MLARLEPENRADRLLQAVRQWLADPIPLHADEAAVGDGEVAPAVDRHSVGKDERRLACGPAIAGVTLDAMAGNGVNVAGLHRLAVERSGAVSDPAELPPDNVLPALMRRPCRAAGLLYRR